MTDHELLVLYRNADHKCAAIVQAMYKEQCTLPKIVHRLQRLGMKPERSLLHTFGTSLPELIPEAAIWEYARNKRIGLDQGNGKGEISAWCEKCFYLIKDYGDKSCGYISIEHRRRGCPAGKGCTKRKAVRA